MSITFKSFPASGGGAGTDTLDDVTGRGSSTANSITVGGVSIGTEYTLPATDGSSNQFIKTDGAGALSFAALDITGGLEYKGSYDASTNSPLLTNAEKGDFYIVSAAGTRFGRDWSIGDHLLINEDMGGVVSNGKIDKIDNTDTPASETVAGVIEIATNVEADAATATDKALVPSNISSFDLSDMNNATSGFISTVAAASETVAGVIEIATNVEADAATATNKALVPGNISSFDLADMNNTTSGFIANINSESLNDLSDVAYSAGAGINDYVLTYDHASTSWGAAEAPTAATASETVAGVIEIATNVEADAATATNKALVPSNISSFDLADMNNTTSGFIANINSESLNSLSDVSYSAGVGINDYVLTYDHASTSWGAVAAAGGSEWTIESKDDSGGNFSAQVGYYYLVNNTNTSTPLRMTLPSPSVGDRVRAFNFGAGALEIRDSGGGSDLDPNDGTTGFQDYKRFDQNCIIDIVCVAAGDYEWVVSPQIEIEGQGSLSTTGQVLYYDASSNKNQLQALPYTFPSSDGSASQVLKTDGAGVLTFVDTSTLSTPASETVAGVIEIATNAEAAAATATDKALVPSNISSFDLSDMNNATSGFIADLVADTTPQLGGNIDVNGQLITSASNGDIEVDPNGAGSFKIRGNSTSGSGRLLLNCYLNTHSVTIQGPPHSASATYTLTLPNDDGDPNQVLKTDGSGNLSWVDQASGGGWTYSAITADPANAQASYHYSCTGTFTITLPTSGVSAGAEIRVKNMGTGTITIDPQTRTIDGSTTDYTMDVQYSAITIVSTGTNWEII